MATQKTDFKAKKREVKQSYFNVLTDANKSINDENNPRGRGLRNLLPDNLSGAVAERIATISAGGLSQTELIESLAQCQLKIEALQEANQFLTQLLGASAKALKQFEEVDNAKNQSGGRAKGNNETFRSRRDFAMKERNEFIQLNHREPTNSEWLKSLDTWTDDDPNFVFNVELLRNYLKKK